MNKYYPFEFHCHTVHSDGSMTPETLIKRAAERNYAGIALTDHNTVSAWEEAEKWGEKCGVNVIRGIEWTTFYGHIVCLHDENIIDWRDITLDNIDEIAGKAKEKGAVLTIAHPKRIGAPYCIGCHFEYDVKDFGNFHGFEVWSQREESDSISNAQAEKMYDGILNRGFRLAALYGYDWHGEDKGVSVYTNTFVGAENPSPEAVKNGIRKGDTYLSTGVKTELFIDAVPVPFGSETVTGKYKIKVKTELSHICDCSGIIPETVIFTGSALERGLSIPVNCETEAVLKEGWLRYTVYGRLNGKDGTPLVFTSPVYIKNN